MTATLPAHIKSSLDVTAKDVGKLLTNSHVNYGTKFDKINKLKEALAGHKQLRSSILIKGRDCDLVAAYDALYKRLSTQGYFTQRTGMFTSVFINSN